MKKNDYGSWLKYYLNINNNLDFFYLKTIKLLEDLNSNIYLEHSYSFNDGIYSKFRGLICLTNLYKKDYKLVYNYLINFYNIKNNKIGYDILNLEKGIIKHSDIIIGFDYCLDNIRFKFYYITINKGFKINKIFDKLIFKDIIKGYDIGLNTGEIYDKIYIVLNKDELIKNKDELIKILGTKLYSLLDKIYGLNIAIKKNGNSISLDFKFNGSKSFLESLNKKYNFDITNLKIALNKTTFLSIKYDIKLGIMDINNFNIYFYE